MVKLSATLSLVDGFSNKLNAVNNSLQKTSSSMDKFKNNMSKPIGGGLFSSINGGIASANSSISGFSTSAAAKLGAVSGVVQSVTTKAIGAVTTSIEGGINRFDTLNNSALVFKNMGVDADVAKKSMDKLKDSVEGLPTALDSAVANTQLLTASMDGDMSKSVDVYRAMNDAILGFGGSAAQVDNAVVQLSQSFSNGKVDAQTWNSMINSGMGPTLNALSKQMGVTTGDLKEGLSKGTIGVEQFQNALINLDKKGGGGIASLQQIVKDGTKGIRTNIDNTKNALNKMGVKFLEAIGGDRINKVFEKLRDGIGTLGDTLAPTIGKMASSFFNIFDKIDFGKVMTTLSTSLSGIKEVINNVFEGFKDTGAVSQIQMMFDGVGKAFGKIGNQLRESLNGGAAKAVGEGIGKVVKEISTVIGDFANNISRLSPDQMKQISSSIGSLAGAFLILKNGKGLALATAVTLLAKAISKMSPEQLTATAKGIAILGAAIMGIKLGKQLSNIADGLGGLFGKNSPLSKSGTNPVQPLNALKNGLGSLAKSAGIALVVGSFAGLALALKPLASLGTTAIAPLLTFGAVVAGLAVVFSTFSSGLTAGILGIGVFAAAISVMALTMSGIANAGAGAVANMITFGAVIGGLAVVFALLGPLLTAGSVGILAFGAAVLMAGIGLGAAAPFMQALPPIIMAVAMAFSMAAMSISMAIAQIVGAVAGLVAQIGNSISQVATAIGTQIQGIITKITGFVGQIGESVSQVVSSISKGFSNVVSTIGESVQGIIDSISGGLTSVLNSVSSIIDSIGDSARNAGEGFKMVAEGISQIASLSIWDIGKSLGAVATGIGQISSHAGGLSQAGSGMQQLANGVTMAASSTQMFVSDLERVNGAATQAIVSASQLQSVFSNITITPPNTAPITAAFTQIVTAARGTVAPVAGSGTQAGQGFVNGFQSSIGQAVSVAQNMGSQITGALSGVAGQMYSIGVNIGQGLANGMNASLGAVTAAASALAAQADKAARAKAEVHSPSRVFMATGQFFGQGLAIGMQKQYDNVANAGAGLFDSAYLGNNEVPSQNTEVIKSSSPTQNANSEVHYTVESGAIVVQGTGNAEYDGELITEALEKHLMSKYSASLLN